MRVWFADSIPVLVGFLRVLQFPPTPKIGILPNFWSIISGFSLFVYKACLAAFGFNYLCVRCGYHTTAPREPSRLISRALQKLLIIIYYLTLIVQQIYIGSGCWIRYTIICHIEQHCLIGQSSRTVDLCSINTFYVLVLFNNKCGYLCFASVCNISVQVLHEV